MRCHVQVTLLNLLLSRIKRLLSIGISQVPNSSVPIARTGNYGRSASRSTSHPGRLLGSTNIHNGHSMHRGYSKCEVWRSYISIFHFCLFLSLPTSLAFFLTYFGFEFVPIGYGVRSTSIAIHITLLFSRMPNSR